MPALPCEPSATGLIPPPCPPEDGFSRGVCVRLYESHNNSSQRIRRPLGAPARYATEEEAKRASERELTLLHEHGQLSPFVDLGQDTCFLAVLEVPGKQITGYLVEIDRRPVLDWDEVAVHG